MSCHDYLYTHVCFFCFFLCRRRSGQYIRVQRQERGLCLFEIGHALVVEHLRLVEGIEASANRGTSGLAIDRRRAHTKCHLAPGHTRPCVEMCRRLRGVNLVEQEAPQGRNDRGVRAIKARKAAPVAHVPALKARVWIARHALAESDGTVGKVPENRVAHGGW